MRQRIITIAGADSELFEVGQALIAVTWGAWLFLPMHTFESFAAFTVFARLAPEELWGFLYIGFGVTHLVRLWSGASRRWFLLLGVFCWLLLALLYWLGNPSSPGIPTYGTLALLDGFLFLRAHRL